MCAHKIVVVVNTFLLQVKPQSVTSKCREISSILGKLKFQIEFLTEFV